MNCCFCFDRQSLSPIAFVLLIVACHLPDHSAAMGQEVERENKYRGNNIQIATEMIPIRYEDESLSRQLRDLIAADLAGVAAYVQKFVEPNGVTMEQEQGTGVWHINGTASAGFKGRPYITPNDVSFINIEVREQTCTGTGTGFYSDLNNITHPLGSWVSVATGTAAEPSMVNGVDTIQSGSKGPPFSNGSFTWPIPWEFRVGSGSAKVFTVVTHQQDADATGKVTISKGGISKTKNASDPTSSY